MGLSQVYRKDTIISNYDGTSEYREETKKLLDPLDDIYNSAYSLEDDIGKTHSKGILFKILINKPFYKLTSEIEDLVDFFDVMVHDDYDEDELVTKEELLKQLEL